uniref:Protein kinase domain-containing protein n=1 Tax=Oryza punctata TaxID=4537 RepID=A0A0E0KM41_ORYPU
MSPHAVPKFVLVLVPSFLVILCSISLSNACTGLEACTSLEQEDWSGSGSISIPTFDGIDEQQSLVVLKNAEIWRDVLRLPASNTSSSGSVLLPFRMELWQQVDSGGMMKNEASFTTTLRFMIISSPTAAASLAFVVVPSLNAADGSLPPALNTANSTTTTTSNNNHSLALDLGSIMSGYSTAVNYTVWIDYDGIRRLMLAYIANDGDPKPSEALFATPLTMSDRVPNKAYVGFMASGAGGQGNSEIFGFLSWNMTVERAGDKRAGQMSKKRQLEYGLMAVILFFSLFCIALIVTLVFLRQNNNETKDELDKVLTCVARKLKYSEISDATNGFSSEVLGEGAFGVVYKGKLSTGKDDEKQERQVAVKKFKESGYWQQYSEFLDEIQVIIQLRHNNIVRLLGAYILV